MTTTYDEAEWRAFMVACKQFKQDGTGSHIDNVLLKEFPLFHGKAPAGHPYPQAFKDGATDKDYCYIECVDDDLDSLVLLRRKLPSGRIISIDTQWFAMLNGGAGIAHLNMNNSDNRVKNLKRVKEGEARKLLMDFEEISVDQAIKYVANYCITNNLYRQGNTFHEFDDSFVNTLNAMFPNLDVDGGYCFLDDNGGKTGLIRFYSGHANPKWSFEMKADGEIEWGGA